MRAAFQRAQLDSAFQEHAMRTMTQPDVFAQIHSEMQNQNPSATGDVFTQIHQEEGGFMIDCSYSLIFSWFASSNDKSIRGSTATRTATRR
jgi:hypothetical protein